MGRVINVIFLCTGNAVRSIMAESILRREGGPSFHGFSAGAYPRGHVDPMAIELLSSMGYPVDNLQSESWDKYARYPFDLAITLCDRARCEIPPRFAGDPVFAHWTIEDPMAVGEDKREREMMLAFTYLRRRIQLLVSLPIASLEDLEVERQVNRIPGRAEANHAA